MSGKVRRVGSAVFSKVVVSDASGKDWIIAADSVHILASPEQRDVRVRGKIFVRKMILADGTVLPDQHELSELKIFEQEAQKPTLIE